MTEDAEQNWLKEDGEPERSRLISQEKNIIESSNKGSRGAETRRQQKGTMQNVGRR